jgi:hypothetical protein
MLIGPLVWPGRQCSGNFHALRKLRSPRFALGAFHITLGGLGRRPAARGDGGHGAFKFDSTPEESDGIARPDLTGRLHPLSVDMDFAAPDSLGREGTGLEQPHAKKPAIDSRSPRTLVCTIFGHMDEYN